MLYDYLPRFKVCENVEPVSLETAIMGQIDYALNFQKSKAMPPQHSLHLPCFRTIRVR